MSESLPTDVHTAFANAPYVTNLVAHCAVCGCQWQVRSGNLDDTKACSFCGADETAVTVTSEAPDSQGAVIR